MTNHFCDVQKKTSSGFIASKYTLSFFTVDNHLIFPILLNTLTESHPELACSDCKLFKRSPDHSLLPTSMILLLFPTPICTTR